MGRDDFKLSLPNLTDLKCDVWENALATWSPELLLIRPIRGETETVRLRQDRTSSGLQVEDPPQALI